MLNKINAIIMSPAKDVGLKKQLLPEHLYEITVFTAVAEFQVVTAPVGADGIVVGHSEI